MGNYEPFLDSLKYAFQLHLESITSLEKKAQNIIIISGIMIGLLVGWNGVEDVSGEYIVMALVSTSMLIAGILYSRNALKVHKQILPWNIPHFFQLDGTSTPIHNNEIIEKVLIYDIAKIKNESKYLESPQVIINKIKYEHNEIRIYLKCCFSALKNSERISKHVKNSEYCFILGSTSFGFIPLFWIINILSATSQ